MSERRTTRQEFALVQGLYDRGIPLDDYEVECMHAASLGLEIIEDIGLANTAFNLPSGGAGYVLSAAIFNDSDRPLSPMHIGFEGPDWESGMRLLLDPQKEHPQERFHNSGKTRDRRHAYPKRMATRNVYEFPRTTISSYERDAVLNHRIGPGRKLYPGERLGGLFMAVGECAIPRRYRDRDRFDVHIIVFDQKGQSSKGTFRVMVERSIKEIEPMKKYAKLRESRRHEKLAVAAD